MKCLVLFAVFGFSASYKVLFESALDEYWIKYKTRFGKVYANLKEEMTRRMIWEDKIAYIVRHNLDADLGFKSYKIGLNAYSDKTHEEFARSFNCTSKLNHLQKLAAEVSALKRSRRKPLPSHVDWREQGYVTRVKNQSDCGACWAFSATGALEGQHKRKNGTLVSLSEQQLIDCSRKFGNKGCDGGWQIAAFEYICRNGGIDTEASYPYTAKEGICKYNNRTIGATMWNYRILPGGNEENLQEEIAEEGPIATNIDAGHESFQSYNAHSGIYDEPNCTTNLNHGVLVVGYGTENGKDYWLVKNSWGTDWGIEGYIKMSRNKDNQCGIASQAMLPLV